MFRQGDVLFVGVNGFETDRATRLPREAGRVVVAHGEVTGHAHAIHEEGVTFWEREAERFVVSDTPFRVVHEEHIAVELLAGAYQVIRQRQYTPEEIIAVAD